MIVNVRYENDNDDDNDNVIRIISIQGYAM